MMMLVVELCLTHRSVTSLVLNLRNVSVKTSTLYIPPDKWVYYFPKLVLGEDDNRPAVLDKE